MAISAKTRRILAAAEKRAQEQSVSSEAPSAGQEPAMSPMPPDPARQQRINELLQSAERRAQARGVLDQYAVRPFQAAAETMATLGSGALAEPGAGLAGLGVGALALMRGEEDPLGKAVQTIEQMQETGTYVPRTEAGQAAVQGIGEVMQPVGEAVESAGAAVTRATPSDRAADVAHFLETYGPARITNTVLEAYGLPPLSEMVRQNLAPALGAATRTALEVGGPGALNVTRVARRQAGRRADIEAAEADIASLDVDPRQPIEDVREAVVRRAEEIAPGVRGAAFTPEGELAQRIGQAREGVQSGVNALYDAARNSNLEIQPSKVLMDDINQRLSVFGRNLQGTEMASVRNVLEDLQDVMQRRPSSPIILPFQAQQPLANIPLSEIDDIWKQINAVNPGRGPQGRAFQEIKSSIESFLENSFNAGMISGDRAAIDLWREARGANRVLKESFDRDRVISALAENGATPETIRNWAFGARQAGFGPEAGAVVRRIKEIVGPDSEAMRALQADAALNIVSPLLESTPNFQGFVRNYDRLVKGNQTALNQIFDQATRDDLYRLRRVAEGADRTQATKILEFDIPRFLSIRVLGSSLAKQAEKVRIGRALLSRLREAEGESRRRELVMNILGYDPGRPMFTEGQVPRSMAGSAALIEMGEEESPEE